MMGGRLPQGFDQVGQTVATFPSYEGAQKAVSALIAGDVPARDIAIVGQGLRSIERITGRLGYATAARSGAVNGLLLGLLFSAIFVLGTPSPPVSLFVGVLFVGVAIGMLLSIVSFAIVRRRRDFASVMQVVADHYEVTVAATSIHRARQVLGAQTAAARPAPEPRPDLTEPPRYGERVPASDETSARPAVADAGQADTGGDAPAGSAEPAQEQAGSWDPHGPAEPDAGLDRGASEAPDSDDVRPHSDRG